MYYIVEKKEQLERLDVAESAFVQLILRNNFYHPKLSTPSIIYYNNGEKGYILALEHCESFSLDMKDAREFLSKHNKIYVMDKKFHSYHLDSSNLVDLNIVSLDSNNDIKEFDCDTNFHRHFYQNNKHLVNVETIIPIAKHYEKCECFYQDIKYLMGLEMNNAYDDLILEAYQYVENSGVGVDIETLTKVYELPKTDGMISGKVAYSYYNLYNATSRPTNSFGGINYLAIPKEGDYRKSYVAKNDYLVEFDFDAYHLRLIANLVGFELPEGSIHESLGQQYFNKEQLSEEEYKQAKTITFRQLYGGVEHQYKHIPFLSSMGEYIDREFKKYKAQESYVLPTGRIVKMQSSMTKHKLFNYILQNLETKNNVDKILSLKKYLLNRKTELVLITYDAFLFDFSLEDGKDTLLGIKQILEQGGYPVKHKHGKDYSFT